MKKLLLLLTLLFTLASCSSGWSCKNRYVKSDYSIELLKDQKSVLIICNKTNEEKIVAFEELQNTIELDNL